MFKSNSLLFDDSAPWDPHCVRNFLNIPEDQLNLISNIPEWSAEDNGYINASPSITVKENQSRFKSCDQEEGNLGRIFQEKKNLLLFDKNLEIRRKILQTFVLDRKPPLLSRSFSFCNKDEFNKHSKNNYKLKQYSSAPSIHQIESCEIASVLNNLKSRFFKITKVLSLEHSKLNFHSPEFSYTNSEKKKELNKTLNFSSVLNSGSQHSVDKILEIHPKLSRQHLLSEITVCADSKMSEISMKQISHDIASGSEGDTIDPSKFDESNVACQALREISLSNQIATSEVTSFSTENKHSLEQLEDNSSQKENTEVLNACRVKMVPNEKGSVPFDSSIKQHMVHLSQNSLKLDESKENQNSNLCAQSSSSVSFDDSICSQAIPCGQQPPDNINTTHSLIEDNDNLVKVSSNLDFQLSNTLQTSTSVVENVPQQGSILSTEKEQVITTLNENETISAHEKTQKSNQKSSQSSSNIVSFDESICSQAVPCGQQPPDNINTTLSLIEDNESLVKVSSNLDFQLSNRLQTSTSVVENVPQQGSVLITEKEQAVTILNENEKNSIDEKTTKSNQKRRKSSHGKQNKGLPSAKYARGPDEISFTSNQLEKMLNLMKNYLPV